MSVKASVATIEQEHISVNETAEEREARRKSEARVTITTFVVTFILYFTTFFVLDHFFSPPGWVMNQIVQFYGYIFFGVVFYKNKYPVIDDGVKIKSIRKTILPCLAIAVTGFMLMVLLKIHILKVMPDFFPVGAPFWDWSIVNPADFVYPFTVILQEYLAFIVFKGSIEKAIGGDNANILSLVWMVLLFGILHIAYGPLYMLASVVMMGLLGLLYCKQRCIWGLCIIHFVFGEAATFLRFIE